jgi:hypothetical protein
MAVTFVQPSQAAQWQSTPVRDTNSSDRERERLTARNCSAQRRQAHIHRQQIHSNMPDTPVMTSLRRSDAGEISAAKAADLLSRRQVLNRLALIGLGSTATAAFIAGCSHERQPTTNTPNPFSWTYRTADFTPRSIGTDGWVYGNGGHGDRVLKRSGDGGETFENGFDLGRSTHSAEYIRFCTRTTEGYIAVTSIDATDSGRIWFSTSFIDGFTVVQHTRSINEFSVSKPETGFNRKTWLAVGEYSTNMPQPVHRLWHSTDGGRSWRIIRTAQNIDPTKNAHYHGCCHDPSNDMRLYSSQGDNINSRFSYTDNPESPAPTWVEITLSPSDPLYYEEGPPQPTTVGVFPAGRLFATPDRGVAAGMWSMSVDALNEPTSKWQTPGAEKSQNMFGRSPYAQSDTRAVVAIPDRFQGTLKAYFVATGDSANTWHLIHTMDLSALSSGSRGVVGPDHNGLIFYRSIGNPLPAGDNLMVAEMPTFTSIQK